MWYEDKSPPMIRYNHPGDTNVWFVQAKEDEVPSWAVNVEDYDPESLVPDKGHRCDQCQYAKLKDYGYSSYTVEGTTFSCMAEKHPNGSFDRWYGEEVKLKYANSCDYFSAGRPIRIGVEGDIR